MKNYLQLARIKAKHGKMQNRMTIFCIVLAVFLVTSVFSMVDFEYIHMYDKLIKDHGNWHITLSNVPKDEAESVWKEADVTAACWYDALNYNLEEEFYINGQPVCVVGTEETFFNDFMVNTLIEGRFPQSSDEIVLNENAKNILRKNIGESTVINTPAGDYQYTVCGFAADTSKSLADGAVIAVLDLPAFEKLADECEMTRELMYYIQFEKSFKIKDTIARLKAEHGWTDDNVGENAAVLGIMGMSTSNYIVGLYGVGAVLVIIVVLAGVFMISGSMNTNVAERTQYFGLLRCIGASKKQVRRIVRREALNWLKIAIPIGCGLSIAACWVVCAVLAYGIGGEWAGMPVGRISITGILSGMLIGFITVFCAAYSPSKRAAKVSPAAAVSGYAEAEHKRSALMLAGTSAPVSMGIHHAVSNRKNLILMTGSFALSIILFLVFSIMIVWIDNALTSNKPYSPDLSIYYRDYHAGLSKELSKELSSADGVKYAYGRMHIFSEAEYRNGVGNIDLISYDDIQFKWAESDLLLGDISKVENEPGNVIAVYDKYCGLELGDTVMLNGTPLFVAALISDSPFSADGTPILICSEETFITYTGCNSYSVVDLQLEKGADDTVVSLIRGLLKDDMTLSDRRAGKTEANSTYLAFTVLVYSFLGLVALIAVFNIINSISMSVTARRKQYGMMRAIGMDKRQLRKIITAEALGYALSGCIAGCAIGLPLHSRLFTAVITNYWGIKWALPGSELMIIVSVVILSAVLSVIRPYRLLSEMTVVDTINS